MQAISKQKNSLESYLALAFISARSNFAYVGEVISRQLFLAAILYIFLRLWKLTYAHCGAEQMAGLSLPQMLWYLGISEAIFISGSPISATVDEDIRTGALAVQLVRPMPYPIYKLALYMGERYIKLIANFVMAALLCLLLVGEIPITSNGIIALAITLPLCLVLDFLGNFLVGLAAFWLENTSGISFIYSKLVLLLGGVIIPLDLLPFANIVKVLPFASMIYGPARQFVRPIYSEFIQILILQSIWVIIFSLIVWQVYRLALKRIAANGG